MKRYKLSFNDFEAPNFCLYAIHNTLEDYRLVYWLNNKLRVNLVRTVEDLKLSNAKYPVYEWEDEEMMRSWKLISNVCKTEQLPSDSSALGLFDQLPLVKTHYLFPQYKKVHFFLKLSNFESLEKFHIKMVKRILSIPQTSSIYRIDLEKLRDKTSLLYIWTHREDRLYAEHFRNAEFGLIIYIYTPHSKPSLRK